MRVRRGNYAILFVLTAALLMSYLAFSIDAGRMRVAHIQAENAAEAAALAALDVLRVSGDKLAAVGAGTTAANEVPLQRLARDGEITYELDFEWGTWDWNAAIVDASDLGARWTAKESEQQAITVSLRVESGLSTVFGPAVDIVAGRDGGRDSFTLGAGARAAYRTRDIVVLVDVSRWAEPRMDEIQGALAEFITALEENQVLDDRLAVVAFAGDTWLYDLTDADQYLTPGGAFDDTLLVTEPGVDFYGLHGVADTAREVSGVVESCYVGDDAFFYYYRHKVPGDDPDLLFVEPSPLNATWDYRLIGNRTFPLFNQFRVDPSAEPEWVELLNLFTAEQESPPPACASWDPAANGGEPCPYWTWKWNSAELLGDEDRCRAWLASEMFFLLEDARRARSNAVMHRAPLNCHDGNYFETSAFGRYEIDDAILTTACDASWGFVAPGMPRYGTPTTLLYVPDRAYTMAGVRHGRALERARTMFEGRADRTPEPTVVLITASAPRCGPSFQSFGLEPACTNDFRAEALAQANLLGDIPDANVYVVGLLPNDSVDAADLAPLTRGRGWYVDVFEGESLADRLEHIARDMKIQVVQ